MENVGVPPPEPYTTSNQTSRGNVAIAYVRSNVPLAMFVSAMLPLASASAMPVTAGEIEATWLPTRNGAGLATGSALPMLLARSWMDVPVSVPVVLTWTVKVNAPHSYRSTGPSTRVACVDNV